jgi:hypothetical protein
MAKGKDKLMGLGIRFVETLHATSQFAFEGMLQETLRATSVRSALAEMMQGDVACNVCTERIGGNVAGDVACNVCTDADSIINAGL